MKWYMYVKEYLTPSVLEHRYIENFKFIYNNLFHALILLNKALD